MAITLLDALIVVALIVGFIGGWKRGFLTEFCSFVGLIVIVVVGWLFKGHLSTIMYKFLPFFKFGGDFEGISSMNILIYELIAFVIIILVLSAVLAIILKATGNLENIFRGTVLLGVPSKIFGGVAGALEAYVVSFVVLCVLSQPYVTFVDIESDKIAKDLLNKTPLLSKAVDDVISSGEEIVLLVKDKNIYTQEQLDYKTLEILLKNGVVSSDSVDYLVSKGKIEIQGSKDLANKYRKWLKWNIWNKMKI